MNISNTVVKTVSLKPGENFILPPGASIVSVIGTLTNNCGALPTPESLSCFGTYLGVTLNNGDSHTWQDITLNGVILNNIKYPFTNVLNFNESGSFSVGGVGTAEGPFQIDGGAKDFLLNPCLHTDGGDHRRGTTFSIIFKTFSSLMQNASFYGTGDRGAAGGSGPTIQVQFPIRSKTDMTTEGITTCNCS